MRFQFDHFVSAFAAGYFRKHAQGPAHPAFAYATFHNKIYVYFNVELPRITLHTAVEVLERRLKSNPDDVGKTILEQSPSLSELVVKMLYESG